jgi:outer membrane protein assembly factor BamB
MQKLLVIVASCAALLLTLAVDPPAAQAEVRTWNSADGQYSTQAEFVDYQDRHVLLRKADGSEVRVLIDLLGHDDRLYVRSQLRARSRQNAAPANGPAAAAETDGSVQQWPRWRGPNADGICRETGLLQQWPDGGPPLVWLAEGLGTGFAGVSVAGGKIFTLGRRERTEYLMAVNPEDGQIIWATAIGPGRTERGSNGTPTVDGDLVFGVSIEGDVICAAAEDGRTVWQKNFARDFGGRMMSGWGFSESPLVDGDLLICTPGGPQAVLAALNKRTGQTVWTTAMPDGGSHGKDGAGYSSVVISHGAGVKQYVTLVGRGLIGVDAGTGRLLWRYDRIANGTANIPTAIVSGDYLFCSSGYGTGAALLKLVRSGNGVGIQEQYFLDAGTLQNHHGGMVLVDGHIYCGHGHNNGFPICVELQSGQVRWGGDIRGPGSRSAAVLYADGNLYFRYEDGVMALIAATPDGYQLRGSFKLASVRAQSWPHPVIHDGRLYLRDQEALMCYDLRQH